MLKDNLIKAANQVAYIIYLSWMTINPYFQYPRLDIEPIVNKFPIIIAYIIADNT